MCRQGLKLQGLSVQRVRDRETEREEERERGRERQNGGKRIACKYSVLDQFDTRDTRSCTKEKKRGEVLFYLEI